MHTAIISIPGGYAFPYGDHSDPDSWTARIWIKAPAAVGQYSAGTQAAAEFLSRQLEELARNPDQQPVYVQLYAGTGVIAHSPAFSEPQDGFYFLTSVKVDYTKSQFGFTIADIGLEYVSPGPPRRVAIATSGGALNSTFSGTALNWVAFPFGSTGMMVPNFSRTGSEGAVPWTTSITSGPTPFVFSATIGDWFKGGCHVYDSMLAGGNPPPINGSTVNSNWVEVFGVDHKFVGNVVLANGFQLLELSPGLTTLATAYLWNTTGTPAWQQFGLLYPYDNAGHSAPLRHISLTRVCGEEIAARCITSSDNGQVQRIELRLQRGAYFSRLDLNPVTQANTIVYSLLSNTPAAMKIIYNDGVGASVAVIDPTLAGQPQPTATTDYGFGAAIINNSSYPFLFGWFYQNPPAFQPYAFSTTQFTLGDSSGPAQGATRSYGLFAKPLATPQNYQAEGESGALGTGWSSQADANASGGNTARAVSGTGSGNADLFGTAFSPPGGTYYVAFRVRVTSSAGAAAEMTLGWWDTVAGSYFSGGSATFKANQASTGYTWLVIGPFTTATFNGQRFRAVTAATLGTDWYIDEAALLPYGDASFTATFPADLWQQWLFSRTTKLVID